MTAPGYHLRVLLVLASASPRRADLLTAAGIPFIVRPSDVDETMRPGEDPEDYVTRVATAKAAASGPPPPDTVILAADTTVFCDLTILGKPKDDADAVRMLRLLSGTMHVVATAVVLAHAGGRTTDVVMSRVSFHPLSAEEIAWYVASGEPRDRAGAYAIQGLASRFVARVEGSYSNVVGLPVDLVYRRLLELTPGLVSAPAPGAR